MIVNVEKIKSIAMFVLAGIWLALIILILNGCGSVSIEKHPDGSYKATTRSLFKDIKDVNIEKTGDGEVNASMGSSVVNQNAESALMLVCTINPALPLCLAE